MSRRVVRVVIDVETVNSAFDYTARSELKRIIDEQVWPKMAEQQERRPARCTAPEAADKLLDKNGNTVGSLTVYLEGDET